MYPALTSEHLLVAEVFQVRHPEQVLCCTRRATAVAVLAAAAPARGRE
jgi:hypothetical protein